ncbi:hypothetical protein M0812_14970 [Anaeramoeba flamelloides]|uniref:Transposase n=1 Tax=Anaeramoeba flamelloides TaxID=1746091 RepID=A0AAV7ZG21_9EUKA|nr:hypothetical protein M0812_14970 [Anaeramoeba flamelloides]
MSVSRKRIQISKPNTSISVRQKLKVRRKNRRKKKKQRDTVLNNKNTIIVSNSVEKIETKTRVNLSNLVEILKEPDMNCFTFLESNKEKIKKGGFYQILCRKCGATICGSRYSMKRHLLTSKHRRGFGPNGQTASELIIQDSVDRVTQTFLQASVPIDKFHRLVNRDSIVAFRSLGSIPSIRTVRRSISKKWIDAMLLHCKKLLEETLLEYEIDWQQITNFVTDGARACVSLGRRLNEQYAIQHTLCAAHLLHLISQKLMESFPNINGLCKLVRVFFKRGIQAGRKKRWRSQNITDISLPSKNTLGNLVKMCFRCVHETQKTYLLFITKEETSETANQMIKCLSNEGSIQDLRFIEYFSRLFTPLIDGIQERQLRKDTLNRWRNIETWLFKMSGKDYAKNNQFIG